jgi:hypothetical protein
MFVVFWRKKCALMMVEPPGNLGRRGVFEIYNGILITGKLALVEKRSRAMKQSKVFESRAVADALAVKPREQGRRCGTVKALVMEEDPDSQE